MRLLIAVLCLGSAANAATYYIAASGGNDSNSCSAAQTIGTPKLTMTSAWGCLSAGDTLIVRNGTYTTVSPPSGKSGSSGSVITVRAENDNQVTFGGMTVTFGAYLDFEGIKFVSSGTALTVTSTSTSGQVSHHVNFRRCGFNTTSTAEDGGVSIQWGSHHILMEDFWAWGGGRYTISCYGGPGGGAPNTTCDNNTWRRGVIRQGPATSSSGNPEASLAMYYASNNIIENVIALDGNQDSNSSNAGFYITSHAPPPNVSGNKYYGVISLNNNGTGWYVDADNGANSGTNELQNSVIWDSSVTGVNVFNSGGSCANSVVNGNTIGVTGQFEAAVNFCTSTVFTNNIFIDGFTYGLANKPGSGGSIATADYNGFWSNTSGARSSVSAGAHDLTSDPALLYPTRVETGSPYKTAGQSSRSIGANVVYRYVDGVETATPLWPWPNEAQIKTDICATSTAGWCSPANSGKTLTDYVWSYTGNTTPSDILNGAGGGGGSTPTAGISGKVSVSGRASVK